MSTRTNELLGVVYPDGSLELTGKLTVPPGRVRVRVESLVLCRQGDVAIDDAARLTHETRRCPPRAGSNPGPGPDRPGPRLRSAQRNPPAGAVALVLDRLPRPHRRRRGAESRRVRR